MAVVWGGGVSSGGMSVPAELKGVHCWIWQFSNGHAVQEGDPWVA